MTMTVKRFRREVGRRRGARRRGAPRYPQTLVAFAVQHARAVRAHGGSVSAAARELGLSAVTLETWLSRGDGQAHSAFREVTIDDAPPTTPALTLTLTAPSGHVVNGLSVEQAAALLRVLS